MLCALLLAWGGVALGSFQYDDFANVLTDPATTDIDALLGRLIGGIRPLTRLSYAVCAQLFGEWAGGWLLIQWVVHAAVVAGIIRLVQLRTGDRRAAFIAGACFALLPSHAASIAYVSGRSSELATALVVAALILHEFSLRSARAYLCRAFALTAFVLACAARETALVFPLLVLLWECTRASPIAWAERMRRTAPYLLLAAGMTLLALIAIPRYRELLAFSLALRSPAESLLHNLAALPASLTLAVRPWALSVEHTAPTGIIGTAIGSIALVAMTSIAVWQRHRPLVTMALLWPIVALLPTHSLIARLDPVTEGPLYLALIGPSVAFGCHASRWVERPRFVRHTLVAATIAAIGLCAWRTTVWADPVALWREATASAPDSTRAWINLGMAHLNASDYAPAHAAFHKALELDPTNVRAMLNIEMTAAIHSQEPREAP